MQNVWCERNRGFACVYLGEPDTHDAYTQWVGGLSNFHVVGDLKYGIYVANGTNRTRLVTHNIALTGHEIEDVILVGGNGYWSQGPGIYTAVDTASGHLATWGQSYS